MQELSVGLGLSLRVSSVVSRGGSIVVSRDDSRGISIVVSTECSTALSVISMKACCPVSLGVSKLGAEQEATEITNTRYDVTANILEVV
jgi:hypothetical protein